MTMTDVLIVGAGPTGLTLGAVLTKHGVATTVVWLGLLILWLVLMAWWQLAAFERNMTMKWLNVNIPPMSLFVDPRKTRWERLRAR